MVGRSGSATSTPIGGPAAVDVTRRDRQTAVVHGELPVAVRKRSATSRGPGSGGERAGEVLLAHDVEERPRARPARRHEPERHDMSVSATSPHPPRALWRSGSEPRRDAAAARAAGAGYGERLKMDATTFPGCRAVHIARDRIADYDGRIECWDAATETAMVCEPTSPWHERPSQRLAQMAALIAVTRGAPIELYGTADLLVRDERGERRRIMQADQALYLHPGQDGPTGEAMVVGEDALPDVVVEVDHTTDVRRGKLAVYEAWGLPEVWVEVPDRRAQSRAPNRVPGLTIHVSGPDGYHESPMSLAFPGWTAAEIHRAMNEPALSMDTMTVLDRVGRALRDREQASGEDAASLGGLHTKSHAEGRADRAEEGRAEDRAEGRAEDRAEGRAEGRAQGRVEGRAEQRALLCRQAALRFDAATAERLAARLADIDDPAVLASAADWIVLCASGAELLARLPCPRDTRQST